VAKISNAEEPLNSGASFHKHPVRLYSKHLLASLNMALEHTPFIFIDEFPKLSCTIYIKIYQISKNE